MDPEDTLDDSLSLTPADNRKIVTIDPAHQQSVRVNRGLAHPQLCGA